MQLTPDDIDNRRTDLEDHPAVWVGIQRPQGSESSAEVLSDSDYLSVEKGHAFSYANSCPFKRKPL
jgi:hypothetical protein